MASSTQSSREPLAPLLSLIVAVVAVTICLVLWAVDYQHSIATGLLVGAAASGVICRVVYHCMGLVLDRIDHKASDMWWHGYATCLEDTAEGGPRTVVPFRPARGDKIGDTGRRVNGSEVR